MMTDKNMIDITSWWILMLAVDGSAVDIMGPYHRSLQKDQIINHPNTIKFKLLDASNKHICYGQMVLGKDKRQRAPLCDVGTLLKAESMQIQEEDGVWHTLR